MLTAGHCVSVMGQPASTTATSLITLPRNPAAQSGQPKPPALAFGTRPSISIRPAGLLPARVTAAQSRSVAADYSASPTPPSLIITPDSLAVHCGATVTTSASTTTFSSTTPPPILG